LEGGALVDVDGLDVEVFDAELEEDGSLDAGVEETGTFFSGDNLVGGLWRMMGMDFDMDFDVVDGRDAALDGRDAALAGDGLNDDVEEFLDVEEALEEGVPEESTSFSGVDLVFTMVVVDCWIRLSRRSRFDSIVCLLCFCVVGMCCGGKNCSVEVGLYS